MSEFISAIDLRRNQTVIWKDDIYMILDHSFNKTAMRGGIVKCKVKNLKTGTITIEDFSGMKFAKVIIDKLNAIFSYSDEDFLYFLDSENYSEIKVSKKNFEEEIKFLEEGLEISLSVYEDNVLSMTLPDTVCLTIKDILDEDSEQKKALLSTGLIVMVPKFCEIGEQIYIFTSDGRYKSR